ncbi:ComEC/Rec2 family competence protein [Paracoccus pacificus]|uniref:ComEC/Rec2 family competence protein n=1 Tax=Paracoccus pacificus TaxID=1463598 RepID=A0ABW4RAF2_9RHOB
MANIWGMNDGALTQGRHRLAGWFRHGLSRPAPQSDARYADATPVAARSGLMPWAAVALAIGIGGWFALPFEPGWRFYAGLGVAAALALMAARLAARLELGTVLNWPLADLLRMALLGLVLGLAGALIAGLHAHRAAGPVLTWRYYGPVEGRVVAIDRSARDLIRLTLDQVVMRNLAADRTPLRVRLSLHNGKATALPAPGTRVMLTAHLSPPPGPSEPDGHDFRLQSWFDGLGAVGYSRNPVMTVAPAEPGGALALHRLRMRISAAIQRSIDGQAGAVASALMTGDRSGIEERTNDIMRASNLYHIVSISGLHMGMLAGFVYGALRLVLAAACAFFGAGRGAALRVHKWAALAAILAAGAYLWISGGDVATKRAFIMVAVMLGAILADRRAISLRTVAVAAIAILVISPEALVSPGFQMSFAATVALIVSYPWWTRARQWVPPLIQPAALLLISSFVAGAATSPLAAAHFNRVAEYGLIANLLVVPVMGAVVMPAGVIAGLLGLLGLAGPALWVMGLGTEWMLYVAEWITGLKGATRAVVSPPGVVIILLGLGGVAVALCLRVPVRPLRKQPSQILGWLGVAVLGMAFTTWMTAGRPGLLVSAEGDAVGMMTPAGRAMSKPKGGAFAAETWLISDGDTATQQESAARPLWTGPANERRATWPGTGWQIVHATGKGALTRLDALCAPQTILITNALPGDDTSKKPSPKKKSLKKPSSTKAPPEKSSPKTAALKKPSPKEPLPANSATSPKPGPSEATKLPVPDMAPTGAIAESGVKSPQATSANAEKSIPPDAKPPTAPEVAAAKADANPTGGAAGVPARARKSACLMLDPQSLRKSGAVRIEMKNGLPQVITARRETGRRLWTAPGSLR